MLLIGLRAQNDNSEIFSFFISSQSIYAKSHRFYQFYLFFVKLQNVYDTIRNDAIFKFYFIQKTIPTILKAKFWLYLIKLSEFKG